MSKEFDQNNFKTGKYLLREYEVSVYPGYRGGNSIRENLVTYRQDPEFFEGTSVIKSEGLAFDIERNVKWDPVTYELFPFTYSMMIDGFYNKNESTASAFIEGVKNLQGYVMDNQITLERHGMIQFISVSENLFVNWSRHKNNTCIGVIQIGPEQNLEIVLKKIVPNAVEVFNILSPTYKVGKELIKKVEKLTKEGAKITPKRR